MKIFVEDSFDSAHWLPNVPASHKCRQLHGHTYRVRFELSGLVGEKSGWVMDYADVRSAWEPVRALLDHKCLNEVEGLENPTCEHLAMWLMGRLKEALPELYQVEIRETERCGVVLTNR